MNRHADREKGSEGCDDARACARFLAIPLNRCPASCGGAQWPRRTPSLTISEPPRLVMSRSETGLMGSKELHRDGSRCRLPGLQPVHAVLELAAAAADR